jgi:prepilin-type N-terminal cleavage/methylation domain-containing protein
MKRTLAKKNGKRGFTLVEVIVVLVILAILAAIAIPALTGYIDKANNRALISDARSVRVALQTLVSEEYGEGRTFVNITDGRNGSDLLGNALSPSPGVISNPPYSNTIANYLGNLVGNDYSSSNADGLITGIRVTGNKVTEVTLQKGDKKVIYGGTGNEGKYKIENA